MKNISKVLIIFAVSALIFAGCTTNNSEKAMEEEIPKAMPSETVMEKDMDTEETMNKDADMATEDTVDKDMTEQKDMTNDQMTSYVDIKPVDAKKLIEENPQLVIIDVSPLYANGHLPNAINYYVGDGSLDEAIPMLNMDATYLVYCHSDSASMLGAQKLIDAGFTNVYRLEGNFAAWVDAGYEVIK